MTMNVFGNIYLFQTIINVQLVKCDIIIGFICEKGVQVAFQFLTLMQEKCSGVFLINRPNVGRIPMTFLLWGYLVLCKLRKIY